MNARTLAALALSATVGAFAFAPAHAQDTMAASSSTAMSHGAMQSKDAMHKDGMKMKKDAMKSKAMHHDGMMKTKKDDAMKTKKHAGKAMSGG